MYFLFIDLNCNIPIIIVLIHYQSIPISKNPEIIKIVKTRIL